jgi:hypothetical protein
MAFGSFVQANSSSGAGPGLSVAFGTNNTAGNILVALATNSNGAAPATIADTQVNNWLQAGSNLAGRGVVQAVYYALGCKAGANTVSTTANLGGTTNPFLLIGEYGGVAGAAFDTSAQAFNAANDTVFSVGPIITRQNAELLVALGADNFSLDTLTAGGAYTTRLGSTHFGLMDTLSTTAGSYTATGTWGVSTLHEMALLAFSPVSLGGSLRCLMGVGL